MNQFNTKEFKKLQSEWYRRLKEEGFDNLEDIHENLYCPDRRTIAWQNRDAIREFFFKLDRFLNINKDMPKKHYKVLSSWSEGIYIVDIAKNLKMPVITCKQIIAKYKKRVIEWEEI